MTAKHVPPAITERTFSCPHCGAYTSQTWFDVLVRHIKDDGTPVSWSEADIENLQHDRSVPDEARAGFIEHIRRVASGLIFLEKKYEYENAIHCWNLSLSRCFACSKIAVWVHDRPAYPAAKNGPQANADLPPDVLRDYEEAQSIVGLSPRGAAALLRLAIQKLCKFLGESGKDLDADIASLVKKGLNPVVQKALDIVRVIGNESVHPGVIDLRDDVATATQLFALVNLITEQMISAPKHVESLYKTLPETKRQAIEKRDKKS